MVPFITAFSCAMMIGEISTVAIKMNSFKKIINCWLLVITQKYEHFSKKKMVITRVNGPGRPGKIVIR
jgi:hypothetical protein